MKYNLVQKEYLHLNDKHTKMKMKSDRNEKNEKRKI